MLLGIILGLSIALTIASFTILAIGISKGIMQTAFTGAVIGGDGYISYAIIIFVFSLLIAVFIVTVLRDQKRFE